mmetsp:Transcript_20980/g.52999  ORF Transcript_20980/g.52999 Transcript_20980/m.52999 type:complete len:158 (-) Transcript_20980:685-1158(-)|eukprot:g17484.t1
MSHSAVVQALKNKLTELYKERNPENLSKIDYLLKKYEGQPMLLYQSVCSKYKIEQEQLTRKVKEWDAATGKNTSQIICNTTGELLETNEEDAEEDEYDPFTTNPDANRDKLTEEAMKKIDCYLLGVTESNLFSYPRDEGAAEPELKKVQAVDSMGEL